MKKFLTLSLVFVVVFGALLPVYANGYAGTSPDSGTCGNNWATDFLVRWGTNFAPTSFTMNFEGSFVTVAGSSPGACEAGPNNGNTVQAGLQGSFSGFFTVNVVGGTFNPSAVCSQATCNTTVGTVHTLFGAGATYNTNGAFNFKYTTCDGKQQWQNASADQGGNKGDIVGGPVACPVPQWFSGGDGRVEPRPGDRIAVYCADPDRIKVYGVADDVPGPRNGFFLVVFSYKAILAAGDRGVTLSAGENGTVSASLMKGWFWIAWNGGKYRATGQGDFKKNFESAAWCPLLGK